MRITRTKFTHYIAREENGDLYLWTEKPRKHLLDGWIPSECCSYKIKYEIDNRLYPDIKWEDAQPTKVMLDCDEFMNLTYLK